MLTRQKHVTTTCSALSKPKDISLTLSVKAKASPSQSLPITQFTANTSAKNWVKKAFIISSEILLITFTLFSNVYAAEVHWYRYYDSRGVPTISSTVSEQHLQYGYDVLDSHMQLIRHYQPFSAEKYAQQQVIREQMIAKRISDRHLQETYVSSDRATAQRDRELENIDGQIQRSEVESKHLSDDLNANITTAANFDRQNKPVPSTIKTQLDKNRSLLNQSNANITALKSKREQTNKQFNDAIAQLKIIEAQSNKPADPTSTP